MLARDNRNFHGWQYRRFVVGELEGEELAVPSSPPPLTGAGEGEDKQQGEGATGSKDDREREEREEEEELKKQGRSMVQAEFDYTTRMVKTDLSNFSAWHNRSKLIPRLLEERAADHRGRRKMLDDGNSPL